MSSIVASNVQTLENINIPQFLWKNRCNVREIDGHLVSYIKLWIQEHSGIVVRVAKEHTALPNTRSFLTAVKTPMPFATKEYCYLEVLDDVPDDIRNIVEQTLQEFNIKNATSFPQ